MSIYKIFNDQGDVINTIVADAAFVEENFPGMYEYVGEVPTTPKPWDSLIDVDPFISRFGAAKDAVLSSTNPDVVAIISSIMVRTWIDLAQGVLSNDIDTIMGIVPELTPAIKDSILATPVAAVDNEILRELYFPNQQ